MIATDQLRSLIEVEQDAYLWGQQSRITPRGFGNDGW